MLFIAVRFCSLFHRVSFFPCSYCNLHKKKHELCFFDRLVSLSLRGRETEEQKY